MRKAKIFLKEKYLFNAVAILWHTRCHHDLRFVPQEIFHNFKICLIAIRLSQIKPALILKDDAYHS